jgi:hypothetical protein
MDINISDILTQIILDRNLHATWLNSLSYLEYRGFRKIVRSQKSSEMTLASLVHSNEEVRHAIFFKRHALKMGGDSFAHYQSNNTFCFFALSKYIYDIDINTSNLLIGLQKQNSKTNYYVVTWLIERRALYVYKTYNSLLNLLNADFSIKPVLRDEEAHLAHVNQALKTLLDDPNLMRELSVIEEAAFLELWPRLSLAITHKAVS